MCAVSVSAGNCMQVYVRIIILINTSMLGGAVKGVSAKAF